MLNRTIFLALLTFGSLAQASNIIRTPAPIQHNAGSAEVGQWVKSGVEAGPWALIATDCATWSPEPDAIEVGKSFTQSGATCSQTESRTLTDILTNSVTGLTRLAEASTVEDRVVIAGSITRTIAGTAPVFNRDVTAGKTLTGSDALVGLYARTYASLDLGTKITNEYGDRVLVYAYRNSDSTACHLRIAVTSPNGWDQGLGKPPVNAKKFLDRYSKISMKDSSGNVLISATLTNLASSIGGEGGTVRSGAVSCSTINTLHSNPLTIKSVRAEF